VVEQRHGRRRDLRRLPPLLEGDVRHLHRTRGDRDADPSRIGAARGV